MKSKRINWTLIMIILFSINQKVVYGQKISWGQSIKGSRTYEPRILGEDVNLFYTYSSIDKELIIEKYEKASMKNIFTKKYDIPKDNILQKAVLTNNKLLFFFSGFDSGKKLTNLYCNTYSLNDGTKLESSKTIFSAALLSLERSAGFEHGQKAVYDNEKYTVLVSSDNKKIFIEHEIFSEREQLHTRDYILLSSNLDRLIDKNEKVSREVDKTFYTSGKTLDDFGSFYFFKNYSTSQHFKTSLICYDVNNNYNEYEYLIDTTKLHLPNGDELSSSSITFDKEGNLELIGSYLKKGYLSGYCFIKINTKSEQIIESRVNEYDQKFTNQFLTERQVKKGKIAIVPGGFYTLKLYQCKDGGVVGVTDIQSHGQLTRRVKQGNFYTEQHIGEYHLYRDIITVYFKANGTMVWANRIPRDQLLKYKYVNNVGRNLAYFSHFTAVTINKIFIGYNDSPANIAITSDNAKLKRFKNPSGSALALFTMDLATGEKSKSMFQNGIDNEVTIEPSTAFQSSYNSDLILIGSKNTKYKDGIVSFK